MPSDIFNYHCFLKDIAEREHIFSINNAIRIVSILIFTIFVYILKLTIDGVMNFREFKKLGLSKYLKKDFWNSIFLTFLIVYRNMFPRIMQYLLYIINCIELGSEEGRFMDVYPDIHCRKSEHITHILTLTVPGILIWVILTPALIFRYMYKRKDLLIMETKKIAKFRASISNIPESKNSLNNTSPGNIR